jgi:hypothetical protein
LDWYSELADKVVDTIMVRDILNIPQGADARKEADIIFDQLWDVQMSFADFAGYYTRQYTS